MNPYAAGTRRYLRSLVTRIHASSLLFRSLLYSSYVQLRFVPPKRILGGGDEMSRKPPSALPYTTAHCTVGIRTCEASPPPPPISLFRPIPLPAFKSPSERVDGKDSQAMMTSFRKPFFTSTHPSRRNEHGEKGGKSPKLWRSSTLSCCCSCSLVDSSPNSLEIHTVHFVL